MKKSVKYFLSRCSQLVLVCPFFMQFDQQPVDNFSILNNLASTMVHRIVDRLSPDSSASLLIRSQGLQQAGNWWIKNWFVKDLQQRGISRVYLNQQILDKKYIIDVQILDLGVEYLPTGTKNLIKRQCKLKLNVLATEGSTGLIKIFDEVNEQYADSVSIYDVTRLENKNFSFTQASLPETQGFKKYIEPLLVMITTVGVVYLFFRLRSN